MGTQNRRHVGNLSRFTPSEVKSALQLHMMTHNAHKANWQDCLCEDLRPVMQYLREQHRVAGWRADADIQQRWSRVYLNKNLSRKLVVKVKEQFANSPQILFLDREIRCAAHNVRLLPRQMWYFEHGINRQSPASFLLEMSLSLLLTAGGFFMIHIGNQEGNVRDIFVGLLNILLFGFSLGLYIRNLIRHLRGK